MAAPFIFASLATNPGGTGSTLTVNLSTHAANDILAIFLPKTGNAAWTVPAGWLPIDQRSVGTSSNGVHGSWFARRVLSGDTLPLADPVCTLGATVTRTAGCVTIRGGSLEGIFVLPAYGARGFSTGTSNPVRPPSVTTLAPEMLVIAGFGQRAATNAPDPSGYTQIEEVVISGTLVMNLAYKTVTDQNTVLSNQDASPTSGARWVAGILCIPSADYPYYRAGSQATTPAGTSVTPVKPTGTTNSDVVGNADVMIATVEGSGSTTLAATDTGLWTEVGGVWSGTTSGGGSSVKKFWCHATATPNMQFTRTGTGEISACITTYYGCDQTDPIGTFDADARSSSTTSTFDAITRSVTKALVQATCVADGVPTFTSPGGWTERMDGLGISCADQIYNATGSSASASFTLSSAGPTLVGLVEIIGLASVSPIVVTPASVSLSITTFAPSIRFNIRSTPTTLAITTTSFAPNLHLTVTPPTNGLTLTTSAPSPTLGVIPPPASLSLATFAPTLSEITTPQTLVLSLTSFAPTIAITNHITVTPATIALSLSTFAPITEPPQILFLDPGGDAVQAIGYFNTVTANGAGISFDTSQKVVGVGSYKFASGASLVTAVSVDGALGGPRRLSCYFRFDTTHTSARRILQVVGTDGIVFKILLSAGDSPVLQVQDVDNNSTSGSAVLAIDTWYRIGLAFLGSANDLDVKLFLEAVEQVSVNLSNTEDATPLHLQYGWLSTPGTDKLCWFDQVYIDDGTDLTDPGALLSTAKLPATVNDSDFDTTGGDGAVNERPLSETNYRQHAASSQVSQNYTLQTAAAGDIDISTATIGGHMGWVWAKKSEAGGSHSLTLNGVDHPIELTTSPALHRFAVTGSGYPNSVAGIGLVSGGSAADTFLYECGVVIAFAPFEFDGTVTPITATLTVSTFAPSLRETATPAVSSLTLTSFAPTLDLNVVPSTASLSLTTLAPTTVTPVTVTPGTASLSTETFAPTLKETVTPDTVFLSIDTFAPTLATSTPIAPASLLVATFAPVVVVNRVVTPDPATLTMSGFAPALNLTITPQTVDLLLATFAPLVNIGDSVTVEPLSASLTIGTFAPSLHLQITPTTQPLTLTTFAPSVTVDVTVSPAPASLVLSSFAPSLRLTVTPDPQSLNLETFAPLVVASVAVIPATANLILSTFAPSLGDDLIVTPSAYSLTLVTFAPSIMVTTNEASRVIATAFFAFPVVSRVEFSLRRIRTGTFPDETNVFFQ